MIQSLLTELNIPQHMTPTIYVDNLSAVFMSNHSVVQARTKHVEIDLHFIRDKIQSRQLHMIHIPASDQLADILTKSLSLQAFALLKNKLHISSSGCSACRGDKNGHTPLLSIQKSRGRSLFFLSRFFRSIDGGVCNSPAADKVEEVMRRFKSDSNGDEGGGAYPDRPGEPDCIYYLRTGTCGYGTKCRFNHPSNAGGTQVHGVVNMSELPQRVGQPDCAYYLKTGTCKYGSTCENHHPKDILSHNPKDNKAESSSLVLNILGLPMRQDGIPCPYYMRTGSCKYGYTCKFHHPQPTSAANVLPVAGPAYGSGSSAVLPSTVNNNELSLSKTAILSGSLLHLPQSCMPVILPGSQSWNTYSGSFSPLSVAGVFSASPASNEQLSVSYFPERPDQPECRYYMNHGSCKYGADCKYHHPRDKAVRLSSTSIGPLGLPLRPGQPVCLYYGLYGLCKYGPTCKYDHPMDGYLYAYSLNTVPPFTTSYSPPRPYQSVSSSVTSSDTPPSKSSKSTRKGVTIRNKKRREKEEDLGNSSDVSNRVSRVASD